MMIKETARKIASMEIRGAGRIARAAARALADYAQKLETGDLGEFNREMREAAETIAYARPTAVSLPNAVRLVMRYEASTIEDAREQITQNAEEFITRSEHAVVRIGELGAHRIRDGDTVLTHCNSSAALSVITTAHQNGKDINVLATETRPRYQGRLTIKHLNDHGIPTELIVDSAARYFMHQVDVVVVGADAVAVNGSLINKIGTSQIALAAHESRVGVMVAAETYKFHPKTILGEYVQIEERSSDEVLPPKMQAELPNVTVRNPAFDITPREYVDLIVTEAGAIPPEMAYTIIREHLGWEIEDEPF